jgi:uncharacterized protein YjbI with pentapeptide repeats
MANEKQLKLLKQGTNNWNRWRNENIEEKIDLSGADLTNVNLIHANLDMANFYKANLSGANLTQANLVRAYLFGANLIGVDFTGAYLFGAYFCDANLTSANLSQAKLSGANLSDADLTGANFTGATMIQAVLVNANIHEAIFMNCHVFGLSAWNLRGETKHQSNLIITPKDEPAITVDNLRVAQFIYLLLNNKNIRGVIDTITSKAVLILGRFTPERKVVLEVIADELRKYDLLPIIFDFERPSSRDFTETIKTLAGICLFIIADITKPNSVPLELQASIPDYQIPFVPIIQYGEKPFSMFKDLLGKFNWVLQPTEYSSVDTLRSVFKELIVDKAFQKHKELQLRKAQEIQILSADEYLKGKRNFQ